ncbi:MULTISPECIES: response regulator [unclassified Azospirillum]|jgi:CheY-like chemotaxis protein|uniref:response regulator n=1 Tax=unclassified Azospirillum TaxID=2630922 RepID=UPI001FFFD843|nr:MULTISPECIES: response regulator [unclassified Azospirillum]MDR6771992.1 CheY-like chemotaxis protein [Azospirillum sp. BE72]
MSMEADQSKPLRILLVEDEPLVAMAIEDSLEVQNVGVIGPAGTVAEALDLIAKGGIDAALLDVSLRGERVDSVADALSAQGIPFVFTTGHGAAGLPKGHQDRPVLTKPFREVEMNDAIDRYFRGAA